MHDVPLRLALAHLDECVLSRLSGLKAAEPLLLGACERRRREQLAQFAGDSAKYAVPRLLCELARHEVEREQLRRHHEAEERRPARELACQRLALREGQRVELLDGVLHGGMRKQ